MHVQKLNLSIFDREKGVTNSFSTSYHHVYHTNNPVHFCRHRYVSLMGSHRDHKHTEQRHAEQRLAIAEQTIAALREEEAKRDEKFATLERETAALREETRHSADQRYAFSMSHLVYLRAQEEFVEEIRSL